MDKFRTKIGSTGEEYKYPNIHHYFFGYYIVLFLIIYIQNEI